MKEIQLVLTNKLGLHARPAAAFVQTAAGFKSQISISTGGKTADAKSILGVLGLGARQGAAVTIRIDGVDEEKAAAGLQAFFAGQAEE
ncbi:MAG: HPr family phosphocarrier protein [bacterium]|jgi:phosphocarrier protein HPr|nr:HPr family phosphocarrier protein [Bacillota bacterium]